MSVFPTNILYTLFDAYSCIAYLTNYNIYNNQLDITIVSNQNILYLLVSST